MLRVGMLIALLIALTSLVGSVGAQGADGNLIANPGLESRDKFDWYGSSASTERVRTRPHSDAWCLHVKDHSKSSSGQGNSRLLPVQLRGGGRYYAEAWARVDPDFTSRTGYGTTVVDVQFFDANERYLSRQNVGKTSSAKWTRMSAVVTLPNDAALVAFRVVPADKVAQLVGAAFADDFYFASLANAEAAGRVMLESGPKPPKGAPEYDAPTRPADGANVALSVEKLTKGFDPQRPLLIWALGSSFTEFLGNGDQLIDAIRWRFPDAPPIVYKSMIGGSTPYGLLRGWARHMVIPDQPDVVLIYNFGPTDELQKLIVQLRTHTTADIIVPTLHWCRNHQVVWPDPDAKNHHQDPVAFRKLCERHGVEFVENRRELTEYMLANGLAIKDLLVDTVHQSPYAAKMINTNIARHFNRALRPAYDPRSRERRIEVETPSSVLSTSGDWKPAQEGQALIAAAQQPLDATKRSSIQVQFTGTRIDLIGWRDPQGGSASVWIDGTPAKEAPLYYATYVQPGQDNFIDLQSPSVDFRRVISDRCPHGILLGDSIVPQQWTITMTSDEGDYELLGSATGPDGKGNASKPFTSQSGQIVIEPDLWRLARTNRTGDRFTFEVYRCAQGQIDFTGPAEKFRTRLVENLPNGQHTLRLEARGDGPVIIDAFDVFEPPHKTSD